MEEGKKKPKIGPEEGRIGRQWNGEGQKFLTFSRRHLQMLPRARSWLGAFKVKEMIGSRRRRKCRFANNAKHGRRPTSIRAREGQRPKRWEGSLCAPFHPSQTIERWREGHIVLINSTPPRQTDRPPVVASRNECNHGRSSDWRRLRHFNV